jgi:hypothetical protein
MAQVQLPSSGSGESSTPVPWPKYQVQTRDSLTDGDWKTEDYLECLTFMQCAAPTMPKASFRWRSGRIKREDKTDFEDVDYTEFADKYVQVVSNSNQRRRGSGRRMDWRVPR